MIVSKSPKQAKPNIAVVPPTSLNTAAMMPNTPPSQETARIRDRAYELYESRGREPGNEQQDWLRAEQEILRRRR